MNRWKKITAAAVVLALGASAGIAWAQDEPGESSATLAGGQPAGPGTRFVPGPHSKLVNGSGPSGTKLVPVEPCRLVDTRVGANTPMSANQTRRFKVRGTGSKFAAQGGKANGCGVPATGVTAVEITVTAVEADKTGFLRVFPKTEPTATFINYTPTFNPSNTGTVSICRDCGDDDLGIKDFVGSTDVVVDLQGYYEFPLVAAIESDGSIARYSRVVSASRIGLGFYEVIFDRDVTGCAYNATSADNGQTITYGHTNIAARAGNANGVFVSTTAANDAVADRDFHVEVIC